LFFEDVISVRLYNLVWVGLGYWRASTGKACQEVISEKGIDYDRGGVSLSHRRVTCKDFSIFLRCIL
jgi:hypothetical protein